MEWTNEWLEEGRAQGLLEGRQQGRQEALQKMVRRQMRSRFGSYPDDIDERIGKLSDVQIEEFAEALLDFQSLADANRWLAAHL